MLALKIIYDKISDAITVRNSSNIGVPIIRIHSSCIFSEAFLVVDCDCASQLEKFIYNQSI
ncbi:MAG: hypothetical protein JKX91_14890 [Rhizobiaceae bacterium]|nr:hypothetical protein [Rhizobiaceae bacterium]